MNTLHSLALIAVMALVTAAIRFLPCLVFPAGKPIPKIISQLTRLLPSAVMGMLVVYCLRNVSLTTFPFGLPELLASAAVVLLHLWKRNTLLSILIGTIVYMVLVQVVF